MDEVLARLDGEDPGLEDIAPEAKAEAFRAILRVIFRRPVFHRDTVKVYAARLVCLAYTVDPTILGDYPTLQEVADRLGVSRAAFHKSVAASRQDLESLAA